MEGQAGWISGRHRAIHEMVRHAMANHGADYRAPNEVKQPREDSTERDAGILSYRCLGHNLDLDDEATRQAL